jgi:hypothetical protein
MPLRQMSEVQATDRVIEHLLNRARSIVDPGNWTTGLDRMPRFRPGDRRGKKDV